MPRRTRRVVLAAALLASGGNGTLALRAATNPAVTVSIDASANRHAISPLVYGVSYGTPAQLSELRSALVRMGGNNTSRYNWQQNADNRGRDWYFESIPAESGSATAGEVGDTFVGNAKAASVEPMLTFPMLPWVAKVGSGRSKLASFSIAKYGAQTDADWSWFPDAGNGVRTSGGNVTGNDPNDANVANSTSFQQQWAQHLVQRWGAANAGGLKYYILDNEYSIWQDTHRDVKPVGAKMDEVRDLMIAYAAALKQADPNAQIVGPEEWGWSGFKLSGYDQQQGSQNGWSNLPDQQAHGGVWYIPYLLDQLRQASGTRGVRLLDVLTVHWYPQGGEFSNDVSQAMQLTRNRSTRALWDPNYTDPTWINDKVQLVPRLKQWVAQYYPGTKTGITEYNWGAESHINGATTQADILGIFGREGLDMAARWVIPDPSTPTYKAMKIYRNYDNAGGAFGDTSVSATAPNPDELSAFAAQRSTDGALTVVVVNKVLSGQTPVTLSLAGFTPSGNAQVYQLTSANAINRLGDVSVGGTSLSLTVPAQSITMLVVPRSVGTVRSQPDFDGDGRADLLWHHQSTGDLYLWSMNGSTQKAAGYLSPSRVADTQWQVRAIADFNGDGRPDVLWHHQTSGALYLWYMNGSGQAGGTYLTPRSVDPQWQIRGAGDFNGDGQTDLLWHNRVTGEVYVWYMRGATQASGAYLAPGRVADTGWQVRGVADFNGDGKPDVLWHHQRTGNLYVWLMSGATLASGAYLSPATVADTQWQVHAVVDLDGDGRPDLVWQHQQTGEVYAWYMTGLSRAASGYLSPGKVPDTGWQIAPR